LVLVFSLLPVVAYAAAPRLAEKANVSIGTRRQIPYRDDYKYFLQPWKTAYRGPERFAREGLESVEKNAIIYADGTTVYPLLFAQELEKMRRDVTIVSGHPQVCNLQEYGEGAIDKVFSERPIYVVSPVAGYCPNFLLEQYDFIRRGVLYRAVKRQQ
jgi:hypothetical protein